MFATITAKIRAAFIFLLLLTAGIGTLGVTQMASINDKSTEMAVNWMPSVDASNRLNTATSDLRVLQYTHIATTTEQGMRDLESKETQLLKDIGDMRARYEKLISSSEERSLYESFSNKYEKYLEINSNILALSEQNKNVEAAAMLAGSKPLFDSFSNDLLKIVDLNVDGGDKASKRGDEEYAAARTYAILLVIAALVIGGVSAFWISRMLSTGLAQIGNTMSALAGGDNSVEVPGTERRDEIGKMAKTVLIFREAAVALEAATAAKRQADADQALIVGELSTNLRKMSGGDLTARIDADVAADYLELKTNFNDALAGLGEAMGAVTTGAEVIQTGSAEIAQASEDLARRTESNAAALEETAAAASQINDRLQAGAVASSQTVKRADQAIATVGSGRAMADHAVQAMGRVSESAKGIDDVIEGLDKIAFQTRVLAMNAAVEAGRAGDAGRGFAVVADLVSALAMRAEEEAKRARDQLSVTQTEVVAAVEAVTKVDSALENISGDVEQVHELLATMAADNQTQAAAVTQISAAIGAMDQTTQQNAAMVEETSAAARNLAAEVNKLSGQASRFKVSDTARRSNYTAPKPDYSRPASYKSPVKALPAAAVSALVREDDDGWAAF
jgi:methyl-accepting chemotaxis protein